MPNILEYVLSLQDGISAKMRAIGVNSDSALNKFSELEKQTQAAGKVMKDMGASAGSLRMKLDALRAERDWIPESQVRNVRRYNSEIKRLEAQIRRLETINGSRIKSWFSDALNSLPFANLIKNPLVIAGAAAGRAIHLGIEKEMQETSFKVLLGSDEAAKDLVAKITQYADKTPYEKMGLGDAAKTMLGFGIAQERIMPNLKAIGDIAMGSQEKMDSLTLAFSQATSAGKLQGQDLLQMINAGFNPLQEISRTTGKSMGTLRKEMEQGKISAKMLQDAFISATSKGGQFYGMADKMSQTLGGRLSTLMDNVNSKFVMLYDVISPVVGALVTLASDGIDAVVSGLRWLKQRFQDGNPWIIGAAIVVGSLTAALIILQGWQILVATWTTIVTAAQWAWNAAMDANPIVWIIAAIIALIAIIGYVIYALDGWGNAWRHLMDFLHYTWAGFKALFLEIWLHVRNAFMDTVGQMERRWWQFVGIFNESKAAPHLNQLDEGMKKRADELAKATAERQGYDKKIQESMGQIFGKDGLHWGDNKSISGFVSKLKSSVGIGGASLPGAGGSNQVANNVKGNGTGGVSGTNQSIATGGTKNVTVHVSIGKQIEKLVVQAANIQEGAERIRDIVVEELTKGIAMGAALGGASS